jgi:hypothetical protein
MILREKLASDFAGIILGVVRNNGWLTEISDTVGINRKHFCRKQMSVMQLHRLLRILTALAWKTRAMAATQHTFIMNGSFFVIFKPFTKLSGHFSCQTGYIIDNQFIK